VQLVGLRGGSVNKVVIFCLSGLGRYGCSMAAGGKIKMKIVLMAILTCTAMVGQTRDELKTKYANAVSETFVVRPGIGVTATYSSTGRIVELLISRQNANLIKSRSGNALSSDILKMIINELVPMPERGKYLMGRFLNIQCLPQGDCVGSEEDYERLTIYYNGAEGGGSNYAVVRWKES
jgi:hypothetical protein